MTETKYNVTKAQIITFLLQRFPDSDMDRIFLEGMKIDHIYMLMLQYNNFENTLPDDCAKYFHVKSMVKEEA